MAGAEETMEEGEAVLTWFRRRLAARYDPVLAEPIPPALLRLAPEPPAH